MDKSKPAMKIDQLTRELPDEWPENIVRLMGKIAIAFAQLEQVVILVAKRFDPKNRMLREFALTDENRQKQFGSWCQILIKAFRDRPELLAVAETVKSLGSE